MRVINVIKFLFNLLMPMAVIAVGVALTYYMIYSKPHAQKQDVSSPQTLVEVITAHKTNEMLRVEASGTVKPAQQIELRPEVSGRIVEQNPNLIPGGRLRKGDVIVRIDPRDYQYAIERQKSQVEEAHFVLTEEEGRRTIAEREWKLLGNEVKTTEVGRDLALRKPHLRKAEAILSAASSSLMEAQLELERTTIRSPFNALLISESVDLGQLVNPQTTLATLVGTDQYWIQVSVAVEKLKWIPLPTNDGKPGAPVRVMHRLENENDVIEKTGRVIRLLGDLEQSGLMARLLIAVDNPLQTDDKSKDVSESENLPLLLGAYVQVEIDGKEIQDVVSLPWEAIQEGNRILIMNDKDELEIRMVKVVWEYQDRVLVQGIEDGERIVTSRLSAPVPGTRLHLTEEDPTRVVQTGIESTTQADETNSRQEIQ